jgi:hypothetical protein
VVLLQWICIAINEHERQTGIKSQGTSLVQYSSQFFALLALRLPFDRFARKKETRSLALLISFSSRRKMNGPPARVVSCCLKGHSSLKRRRGACIVGAEHLGPPSDMSCGCRDAGAPLAHSLTALPLSGPELRSPSHQKHLCPRALHVAFYMQTLVMPVENLIGTRHACYINYGAVLLGTASLIITLDFKSNYGKKKSNPNNICFCMVAVNL